MMAKITDTSSITDILSHSLRMELAEAVEHSIVKELVEDFEKRARALIRERTEKITLEGIEMWLDHLHYGHNVRIKIDLGDTE